MDREEPRPLSVSGWGGGASSRHRPGQAKPTTRRVADGERMNPQGKGGAFAPMRETASTKRAVQLARFRSLTVLSQRCERPPADSNGDSNSSSHRLTSSTDQPQRITLARFGPTGDMPGLKNGRSAEAHHTGAREPMRQAECSSQAQQRGDDEHQGDEACDPRAIANGRRRSRGGLRRCGRA